MIIAHCHLIVGSPSGEAPVPVRVFQPERDGEAWTCRYEIEWPSEKWSRFAAGVDSMQALILALEKIGTEICTSSYHQSKSIKRLGYPLGYGFPLPPNVRDKLTPDE